MEVMRYVDCETSFVTPCGRQVLAAEAEINSTTEVSFAFLFSFIFTSLHAYLIKSAVRVKRTQIFQILSSTSNSLRCKNLLDVNFANEMCQRTTVNFNKRKILVHIYIK